MKDDNIGVELLVFVPAVPVWQGVRGSYLFDRKYFDGILLMQSLWGGMLRCVMVVSNGSPPPFGVISRKIEELPFDLKVVNTAAEISKAHLDGAAIVQAAGDAWDQTHLSVLCQELGIPCVYTIEYTPDTRVRMVEIDSANAFVRFRKKLFLAGIEKKRRRAFSLASGLQANGVPAAEYYSSACSNVMMYFDTRVGFDGVVTEDQLATRLSSLRLGGPLRIIYSGRLVAVKGVDHLIGVAKRLHKSQINFRLDIYGAGDLSNVLAQDIENNSLDGAVVLHGAVDFESELLPILRERTDLCMLLHRQGDPSCTYLETLAAGVPILGYANEAFLGVLAQKEVGWSAPIDDMDCVANTVIRLSRHRDELARASDAAREFALQHTFEEVFKRRDRHLKEVLRQHAAA